MTSVCIFLQAMHLVYRALDKKEPVPLSLPPALLPPSKRGPAVAALPLGVDATAVLNAPVSLHIVQGACSNVATSCGCFFARTRIGRGKILSYDILTVRCLPPAMTACLRG